MDKDIMIEAGKRKGLTNKEHIEKEYFQDLILRNIFRKTNGLVFKGGTALYKIHGLPRFSEDIDFTMIRKLDARKLVEDALAGLGEVKDSRKAGDSILFKLAFRGVLTRYNTLRLDISTKNDVLCGFDVKSYVPAFIDIGPFSLRVLKLREMVAEKIHSLLAREKARDLYDLFYLLRMTGFDKDVVARKLGVFGMRFLPEDLVRRIESLETLWTPELKPFVLGEVVDFRTAKEFVLGKMNITSPGPRR